ncbi:MAG: asparagine synthase (glutamine-hydrolyzing) [Proteobacteria bacterium]|nr:asparagine synthase (glutamine-hydrolyzing) [Pseudomonadota bacterium]NCC62355.1 asparagine synthase (glutamine-hydrolyzing) [Verrucomicrobiae bacterium]
MCGILGYSGLCGQAILEDGLRVLAHRGPDDSGIFVDEPANVGLAHRRLSILDLSSTGHQPMFSSNGQVVLVFNGEIYNFRELRLELEGKGYIFRGNSDTEVLLNLYCSEGEAMLPRLNGIFSFALYDRQRSDLWLARDALGVKPLYWCADERGFMFSSEIKAMLDQTGPSAMLDTASIYRYLSFLWCPGEGTPFSKVHKLAPGEWIRVRDGKVVENRIWYVPPLKRITPSIFSENKAINLVRNGLRSAVHRQLVADVPVGAFLSGGLDSSAVVAFAREQVSDIRCFTISTPDGRDAGEADDLPYAQSVAKHLGVSLDVVEVDAARMASSVERMVWQLDEPLADPAPLNVLFICELARQADIKVLLSGAGGDDLFTGYRRHVALQYERFWRWLPMSARTAMQELSKRLDHRSGFGRRAAKLFSVADLSGDERLTRYFAWAQPRELLPLMHRDVRATLLNVRPEQPMLDFLADMPADRSPLDRMLALEQRFFLADHNLTYTDKMSMAVGVEVRVPFLDLEFIELAAKIPVHFKQRGAVGKWVLKKAMEPYLPHDVIYRPKTGFGAPLRRWIRNELKEMLHDILSKESLTRRGIFDPKAVHRLISENENGKIDAAYILFSILCIEIWCRRYIDNNPGEIIYGNE